MENDSIRASGPNTLVDVWINGKLRAICVSREAIDAFVGPESALGSENDRCEFVRVHMREVMNAARARLREGGTADTVTLVAGDLVKGERRRTDRRKGERRKKTTPAEALTHGERRKVDRRKSDRRVRSGVPPKP